MIQFLQRKHRLILSLGICLWVGMNQKVLSATFTSTGAGGNWNTASTWTCMVGPCATSVPTSADNVIIQGPVTASSSVSANSITVNSGGVLTISSTGTVTYSSNSTINYGGKIIVSSGGTLQDTYNGSYPGGTAVLTVYGGTTAAPSLDVSGTVKVSNLTIAANSTGDTNVAIKAASSTSFGYVLVKNSFKMDSGNGSNANLRLNGLLVIKGLFETSNSGSNIATTGNGYLAAQGGEGNGNPTNTVQGAGQPGDINYCSLSDPCTASLVSPTASDCNNVCTKMGGTPGSPGTITLPITLVSFSATYDGSNGRVKANWLTSSEINNDYFTLERSADLKQFDEIAHVKGAGNSRERLAYLAYDENPLSGLTYYRLKQTDFNGQFSYSSVAVVRNGEPFQVNLAPNPAHGESITLKVQGQTDPMQVSIYNNLGRLVSQQWIEKASGEKISIEQPLANGLYWVKVRQNAQVITRRLLVVNE